MTENSTQENHEENQSSDDSSSEDSFKPGEIVDVEFGARTEQEPRIDPGYKTGYYQRADARFGGSIMFKEMI